MDNICTKCQGDKNINGVVKGRRYCRLCARLMCKLYKQRNKEKVSEYNKNYKLQHKKEISEYNKQYNIDNRNQIQKRHTKYLKDRRKTDLSYKMAIVLRNRVKSLLKGEKRKKTLELLGCDLQFFLNWLSYQFSEGMTMENHGSVWHIDHVIPCAKFDLKSINEQKKCFHWSNMQPMFSSENLSKKDKVCFKDIYKHEIKLYSYYIKLTKLIQNKTSILRYNKIKYLDK